MVEEFNLKKAENERYLKKMMEQKKKEKEEIKKFRESEYQEKKRIKKLQSLKKKAEIEDEINRNIQKSLMKSELNI